MSTDDIFRMRKDIEVIKVAVCAPPRMAYSMGETLDSLGISEPTLREWIKIERIKGTRTKGASGAWLFTPEAIRAALAWTPTNEGGSA